MLIYFFNIWHIVFTQLVRVHPYAVPVAGFYSIVPCSSACCSCCHVVVCSWNSRKLVALLMLSNSPSFRTPTEVLSMNIIDNYTNEWLIEWCYIIVRNRTRHYGRHIDYCTASVTFLPCWTNTKQIMFVGVKHWKQLTSDKLHTKPIRKQVTAG